MKDNEKLNTEKEKKRIARKKERRATLILGDYALIINPTGSQNPPTLQAIKLCRVKFLCIE